MLQYEAIVKMLKKKKKGNAGATVELLSEVSTLEKDPLMVYFHQGIRDSSLLPPSGYNKWRISVIKISTQFKMHSIAFLKLNAPGSSS